MFLKESIFFSFIFIFSSCSSVLVTTPSGIQQYYGINFIENNRSSQIPSYTKIEGFGLIGGLENISLGYIKEETIYTDLEKCSAVLIVDSSKADVIKAIKLLEGICIIRK